MIAADIAGFFRPTDEFVIEASLDAGGPIYIHFDAAYAESLDVASSGPVATCMSADVSAATHGSTLTIDGSDYTVRGIESDGAGVTVLRLHKP